MEWNINSAGGMRSGQIYSFFTSSVQMTASVLLPSCMAARRNTIRPGHVHQRVRNYRMLIIM